MVPDQSHAMADVGYHFANLWFAGERKNWPLAKFCFDETRSHLRWAVRIIPVRKSPTGADLDMKSLLDAVDSGLLVELGKAIDASDHARFATAYRQALEGCYSCHKTAGKPYLRPQVPTAPAAAILNFDPEAKWPQQKGGRHDSPNPHVGLPPGPLRDRGRAALRRILGPVLLMTGLPSTPATAASRC